MTREEIDAVRLQSHLVGPREWDPHSKAKYLNQLRNDKYLPVSQIGDYCGGRQDDVAKAMPTAAPQGICPAIV